MDARIGRCTVPAVLISPLIFKPFHGCMLNKDDPAKQDTEIGGIIKKVIIGAAFLLILPIAVPAITGVDIVQFCNSDGAGGCQDPNIGTDEGAGKLKEGFDKIKPVLVVLLDIFFVIIGLAILFGPGRQLISYRFVVYDATSLG